MHTLEHSQYVPAKSVARWFVNQVDRDAGELITQLKLQKLVYYADAWFLVHFDRPLIPENFEAWAHGPVVRPLYSKYSKHGWDALPQESNPNLPDGVEEYLAAVFSEYGQYGAKKLEKMTHEETPWIEARGNLSLEANCKTKISKLTMRHFYAARIGKKEIKTLKN